MNIYSYLTVYSYHGVNGTKQFTLQYQIQNYNSNIEILYEFAVFVETFQGVNPGP
jgi:hypothetical protein